MHGEQEPLGCDDHAPGAGGAEHVEGVLGAPQLDVDDLGLRRGPELLGEQPGVLDRGERVLVAVHDEERRGVGVDEVER